MTGTPDLVAELRRRGLPAELVVVGEGEDYPRIRRLRSKLGLRRNDQLYCLRVEGADQPGTAYRILCALAEEKLNLREMSATTMMGQFAAYIAFDSAEAADKAEKSDKSEKTDKGDKARRAEAAPTEDGAVKKPAKSKKLDS